MSERLQPVIAEVISSCIAERDTDLDELLQFFVTQISVEISQSKDLRDMDSVIWCQLHAEIYPVVLLLDINYYITQRIHELYIVGNIGRICIIYISGRQSYRRWKFSYTVTQFKC